MSNRGQGERPQARNHWERENLSEAILAALRERGKPLDALALDDLAPFDQFHSGGRRFTLRQAGLARLAPGMDVLDVGGGLGGPARTLAVEFGCRVTVVDLTPSYVRAGRLLNSLMRLDDRVRFCVADALALPFRDETFDVVWTQNSGMNIANKTRLYSDFQHLVRPRGVLAIQEPMAGPNEPPVFPVMWSRDGANHFLRTPDEMRTSIEAAGFECVLWDDVTSEKSGPSEDRPGQSIPQLVMGEALLQEIRKADVRNTAEHRWVLVQAIFKRRG